MNDVLELSLKLNYSIVIINIVSSTNTFQWLDVSFTMESIQRNFFYL